MYQRPGSGLMRELELAGGAVPGSSPTGPTTTGRSTPSTTRPCATATWACATSSLHGAGHLTLPMLGEVVHGISTALAHLDADGSTVTSGVTPLARDD